MTSPGWCGPVKLAVQVSAAQFANNDFLLLGPSFELGDIRVEPDANTNTRNSTNIQSYELLPFHVSGDSDAYAFLRGAAQIQAAQVEMLGVIA